MKLKKWAVTRTDETFWSFCSLNISWFMECICSPDVFVRTNNQTGCSDPFRVLYVCSVSCQRNVWNTRVFRLLVLGLFLVENLITLYRLEQLPRLEKGNHRALRLFPWRLQKEDEQRWKTSMLTEYWPGAHWVTHTRVTEEAKPQLWGDTPWNTDSPGLTEDPLSQTIPASSDTPIPLRLHRACRQTSSRGSFSGKRSRMETRRGTAPWRSNCSWSLAEGDRREKQKIVHYFTGLENFDLMSNNATSNFGFKSCREWSHLGKGR